MLYGRYNKEWVRILGVYHQQKESSHAMVGMTRNGLGFWVFNTNKI